MVEYIDKFADIVESEDFETGVVKLTDGGRLTDAEVAACSKLRIEAGDDDASMEEEGLTDCSDIKKLLEQSRKRRKLEQQPIAVSSVSNKECAPHLLHFQFV